MAMKVSGNNWKTATPRMILDWHQFLRLSLVRIRFVRILPTRYLFIFCIFLLKWKRVNPTIMSNTIYRKWNF